MPDCLKHPIAVRSHHPDSCGFDNRRKRTKALCGQRRRSEKLRQPRQDHEADVYQSLSAKVAAQEQHGICGRDDDGYRCQGVACLECAKYPG